MAKIELTIGPGRAARSFRVEARSDDGEASAKVTLDVKSLLARRRELEKAVLASAVPNGANSSSTDPLREIGETLFFALLGSGDVKLRYRDSVKKSEKTGVKLRVVLRIETPELARLPWESMYDPIRGAYICRRDQFVRHAPTAQPATLKAQLPLRILGIVSSPQGLPPLDVEEEQQLLTRVLSGPSEGRLIELHWAREATWQEIHNQLLLHGPWHVLHFIGHGSFDIKKNQGVLELTGDDGCADSVGADDLVDLLSQAHPMPSLVVLNSCEGAATAADDLFAGTAYALARGGVSAVAAMQYSISNTAASAFTQGFYTAIGGGYGIDEATRSGRIAMLRARGTLEWVTPVMYLRGDETQLVDLEEETNRPTLQPVSTIALTTDEQLALSMIMCDPQASVRGAWVYPLHQDLEKRGLSPAQVTVATSTLIEFGLVEHREVPGKDSITGENSTAPAYRVTKSGLAVARDNPNVLNFRDRYSYVFSVSSTNDDETQSNVAFLQALHRLNFVEDQTRFIIADRDGEARIAAWSYEPLEGVLDQLASETGARILSVKRK
jgi:CHAT domain